MNPAIKHPPMPPHIRDVAAKADAPYCATCANRGTVTRDLTGCESPAARGKHWLQDEPCPECWDGGES